MGNEITKLIRAMEIVRKDIYAELPVQQLHILLTVADSPGITLPEISAKLGMNQGSTSRNVKILGAYVEKSDVASEKASKGHKHAELKGHQLLDTRPDLYNRKSLAVFLTRKGEQVVKRLAKILEVKPPKSQAA